MPVAWYWTSMPLAAVALAGEMLIDCSTAAVTVAGMLATAPWNCAVTVAEPSVRATASPAPGLAGRTNSTLSSDEFQAVSSVTSADIPLE